MFQALRLNINNTIDKVYYNSDDINELGDLREIKSSNFRLLKTVLRDEKMYKMYGSLFDGSEEDILNTHELEYFNAVGDVIVISKGHYSGILYNMELCEYDSIFFIDVLDNTIIEDELSFSVGSYSENSFIESEDDYIRSYN